MIKLIALYKKPADQEQLDEFNKHYFEIHMPLVLKTPGLLKSEVATSTGSPGMDTKYHLICEMYYENMDTFNSGMATPEGKAAFKDLMSFAKRYVEMFTSEVKQ
jgi:uncharacterized protein (TIGR02118 family)